MLRSILAPLASASLFLLAGNLATAAPNVVVFLVDDLGWADVGCNGSTFHKTPNIDRLAESGTRFTDFYASASICSPTRAALMTGRHPVRVDITDWIPGARDPDGSPLISPEDRSDLDPAEVTVAEAFGEAGYRTFYTGKWHLGGGGSAPDAQGFDVYFDPHSNPEAGSPRRAKRGEAADPALGRPHASRELTDATLAFIEESADTPSPFFAYLSYFDVHTPIIPDEEFLPAYQKAKDERIWAAVHSVAEHDGVSRPLQDNPEFASMVSAVDRSVGRVLAKLEELGIVDNTVVVFTSDNGGLCTKPQPGPTCNLPLRAGKGWLYEGGVRVPMIVRFPGGEAGSETAVPGVSSDLFPTLMELCGLDLRPDDHVDGVSLASHLRGGEAPEREAVYWHYPHYHGSTWAPGASVRAGDWKLIEFYHYGETELYNLADDLGERNNLVDEHPEKVAELRGLLESWQEEIGAKMPVAR